MKIEVMRRLILDIDTHQIPDEFIESRGKAIETDGDIDKLIEDFNASKWAARDKEDVQADADIEAWAKKYI